MYKSRDKLFEKVAVHFRGSDNIQKRNVLNKRVKYKQKTKSIKPEANTLTSSN